MQSRTGLGVESLCVYATRRKKVWAPPPTTSTTFFEAVDRTAAQCDFEQRSGSGRDRGAVGELAVVDESVE